MKLLLQIDTNGPAFRPDPRLELSRILRSAADRVSSLDPGASVPLRDTSGRRVGHVALEEEEESGVPIKAR